MHESVKAREIENKILDMASEKEISEIKKVVIRAGRAAGESPLELEHIIKEHLNIKDFQIIKEEAVLKCRNCGSIISGQPDSLNCGSCGSIEIDIISGMGYEIIEVG